MLKKSSMYHKFCLDEKCFAFKLCSGKISSLGHSSLKRFAYLSSWNVNREWARPKTQRRFPLFRRCKGFPPSSIVSGRSGCRGCPKYFRRRRSPNCSGFQRSPPFESPNPEMLTLIKKLLAIYN